MTPLPWLGIEIRHMVALAAVSRTGSFRGAANELGYAQSAISQQVAQLERVIGRELVARSRGAKQVHLTHAGELLLMHFSDIVARFRASQADLAAAVASPAGELRVGFFGGLVLRLLPALMVRLAEEAPRTRLIPVEAATDAALFEQIERGTLDMAFVELPLEPGPFEHHPLRSDPWVLLVQAGSPLARTGTPPDASALAGLPLIAPTGPRSYARVEAYLAEHAVAPRVVIRTETEVTIQALVGSGLGVAIVPRLAVDERDPRIAAIELTDVPPRSLALCWLRDRQHLSAMGGLWPIAASLADELVGPIERELVELRPTAIAA